MALKRKLRAVLDRVRRPFEGRFDDYGRELNSGIPMAPPVGYTAQPSMIEIVRQQIRSEHLRLQALEAGMETFEEADDFDVDDDYDPTSPFEEVFDPVDVEVRNRLRQQDYESTVSARLEETRKRRGVEDGSSKSGDSGKSDEGREGGSRGRVGSEDQRSESGPSKDEESAVSGSVREGIADNSRGVGKGSRG